MGQCEAVAVGTATSTSGAARRLLHGLLASGAMAMAALSSAGVAGATCASINGAGAGAGCTSTPTSFAVGLDSNSSAAAQGAFDGAIAIGNTSTATAGDVSGFGPGSFDTASAVGNPVTVAERMVGTDAFGPSGWEDFGDAVYGL